MSQYGWANCPEETRAQVKGLLDALHEVLGNELIAVYLHGSLAMGCFNPVRSDIDLLVVTQDWLSVEVKRRLVEKLLQHSLNPSPIEISFLAQEALHSFQHPMPYDLHYGESWRERYQQALTNGEWQYWNDVLRKDADLAAHFTVTLSRGICLHGKPAQTVLPPVPRQDYIDSIAGDVDEAAEHMDDNIVYFVLNACRVYAHLLEGGVLSKDEGGVWGMQHLPETLRGVVAHALALYRGEQVAPHFDEEALLRFRRFIEEKIKEIMA